MTRLTVGSLVVLGLIAVTAAYGGQGTVAEQVRVAIQDLTAEPPDYSRQTRAAGRLALVGAAAEPAVPALIKVLGQPVVLVGGDVMSTVPGFDEAIAAVRKALRTIGAPAVTALIAAIGQPSQAGHHAVSLLAEIDDPRALQPLVDALGGDYESSAREALIRLTVRGVEDAVASRLDDPNPRVRRVVVLVLIGRRDVRALPAIVEGLAKGEQYQRWEAVGYLATLQPPDVRERLQALLKDADYMVRSEAASRLGDVGDRRDVSALIELLGDSHKRVRWGAARALGRLRDARALGPLQAALKAESDEGNRQTMAASIAEIKKK